MSRNLILEFIDGTKPVDEATSHIDSKPPEHTTFHDVPSLPHHKVTITGHHKEIAKNMDDGQHYNVAHHLVTTRNHEGDPGTSHFVKSEREGEVIHLRDRSTNKHVATIARKDL